MIGESGGPVRALEAGSLLLLLLLVGPGVALVLGGTVAGWQFWGLLLVFGLWRLRGFVGPGAQRRSDVDGTLLAIALLLASIVIASLLPDRSHDGAAYHQVAISALRRGWNPIYVPHVLDWMRQSGAVAPALQAAVTDVATWVDHYPKASWMLGALVASALGWLEASKWLQFYVPALAALALHAGLLRVGLSSRWAAIAALLGALSPVVIVQWGSNYVDGLLGSSLCLVVGALLALSGGGHSSDGGHRAHRLALVAGAALAANLKFTGVVYIAVMLTLCGGVALLRGWRPSRGDALGIAGGLLVLSLLGATSYLHNLRAHANPVYPLGEVDVMAGQASADFLARHRLSKFVLASLQDPHASEAAALRLTPQLPSWRDYRWPRIDARYAGFGTAFLPALLLALAAWAGLRLSCWRRRGAPASEVVLVAVLLSTLVNPEFWWARYAPQLWLVPLIVAAWASLASQRLIAGVLLGSAGVGVALFLGFHAQMTLDGVRKAGAQWAAWRAAGAVQVVQQEGPYQGLFSLSEHAADRGLVLRAAPATCASPQRFMLVRVCPPLSPPAARAPR